MSKSGDSGKGKSGGAIENVESAFEKEPPLHDWMSILKTRLYPRFFLRLVGAIFLITAALKASTLLTWHTPAAERFWSQSNPVFPFASERGIMCFAVLLEAISAIYFWRAPYSLSKLSVVLYFSVTFFVYHTIVDVARAGSGCGCLGSTLAARQDVQDRISLAILALLFAGSALGIVNQIRTHHSEATT